MTDKTNLHPLLEKLMLRTGVGVDDANPKLKELLEQINRSFYDYEQDQYLLERSMEISSREMAELNEKLESAQKIAHLGYWLYNPEDDTLVWSKEMYNLAGLDLAEGAPNLQQLMTHFDEDDGKRLADSMQAALKGKSFEIEVQFFNKKEKKYYWHYVKCEPELTLQNKSSATPERAISGIVMDITERKIYEQNAEKAHHQLLSVSRKAGMSEVATYVLHNIGNIMNSANISLNLLKDSFSLSYYEKLFKVNEMIKANLNNLHHYFTKDRKGKLIPDYLHELIEQIKKEHHRAMNEATNLDERLTHIKEIVSMQKVIGGSSNFFEKIYIPELVDTALGMSILASKHGVNVNKNYGKVPFIMTDKSRVLQILVNLLQNAEDAVVKNKSEETKRVNLQIKKANNDLQIIIHDNGIGISPENIKRIFSFGFTTKKHGHGFGLHSSALSAKELGGSLTVKSAGYNKGATFKLTLPVNEAS